MRFIVMIRRILFDFRRIANPLLTRRKPYLTPQPLPSGDACVAPTGVERGSRVSHGGVGAWRAMPRQMLLRSRRAAQYVRIVCLVFVFTFSCTFAQDEPGGLVAEDVEIIPQTDLFGQEIQIAEGVLTNTDTQAYTNVNIFADVFDSNGEVIGEGFGFLVNACGVGLIDHVLQPGESQRFSLTLELFETADVDRVEIFPEGTAVDPAPEAEPVNFTGIEQISSEEVVSVEWIDDTTLRYGTGCDADMFTRLQWYEYNLDDGTQRAITHPNAQQVTPALLQQLGLTDPYWLNRSFLTFSPTSRRIVYQTDINTVLTAEPDGSFKRLIWDDLARRSLHGFIWLPEGRFLAYYYGAFGDEVVYFTASLEGQRISGSIYDVVPSMTVPGPTPDGARAVITTTVDDVTGYYLQQTGFAGNELLFEAAPETIPDNNYPAPIYAVNAANEAFVYLVRPIDGVPLLECFNRQTSTLNDLTALPLSLSSDDRAWTWLSPDGYTIVLAANGVDGGLWEIDLNAFGGCGVPLQG